MKLGIRLDVGWVGLGWRGGAITESLEDALKAAFFLWLRMRHGCVVEGTHGENWLKSYP